MLHLFSFEPAIRHCPIRLALRRSRRSVRGSIYQDIFFTIPCLGSTLQILNQEHGMFQYRFTQQVLLLPFPTSLPLSCHETSSNPLSNRSLFDCRFRPFQEDSRYTIPTRVRVRSLDLIDRTRLTLCVSVVFYNAILLGPLCLQTRMNDLSNTSRNAINTFISQMLH